MFHTIITTPDNKSILIPNGGLSTGSINNYSREPKRRVDWSVGISYGDDFANASAQIIRILESDPRVLKDIDAEKPFVGISELGDSAVNLTVRAWTNSSDYWGLYFEMYRRFYAELPALGVNFPSRSSTCISPSSDSLFGPDQIEKLKQLLAVFRKLLPSYSRYLEKFFRCRGHLVGQGHKCPVAEYHIRRHSFLLGHLAAPCDKNIVNIRILYIRTDLIASGAFRASGGFFVHVLLAVDTS